LVRCQRRATFEEIGWPPTRLRCWLRVKQFLALHLGIDRIDLRNAVVDEKGINEKSINHNFAQ